MHLLQGHDGPVRALAYSPDGSTLASGGEDEIIRFWNLATGRSRPTLGKAMTKVHSLAFSPDGRMVASDGGYRSVILWNTATGEIEPNRRTISGRSVYNEPVKSLAFIPGGHFLISGGAGLAEAGLRARSGGQAVICDLKGGRHLILIAAGPIWSVGCDTTGELLAFGTETHLIITPGLFGDCFEDWVGIAKPSLEEPVLSMNFREVWRYHLPRPGRTRSVTFSPDGRTLASASGHDVDLWDAPRGWLLTTLPGHDDDVVSLAFSPDGRTLASASHDGSVRLWGADDGRPKTCYNWSIGKVHCVAFAPDGMTIAAGGDSGLMVWDVDESG